MDRLFVRTAEKRDIPSLKILSEELGYPSSEKQVASRLERIIASPNDIIYVSTDGNDEVTGWIHVFMALRLESDPFAEIGGLVVKKEFRKNGIGKELVKAAEKWSLGKGINKIRVRSRTSRTDTRRFYERESYKVTKEQNVFQKDL